ncbi:hypothetical protein FRC07_011692, partial [Ceratobasidium sp. 392]
MTKLYAVVGRTHEERYAARNNADEFGYVNQHGLSRKHIFESIKHSLERLQLDYVDVLQCHRFDNETPIAETMQALHDVVQAGYVRYIGMSSCHAYQFHAMQNYAINNKLTPFISMQNHHNLLYREEEREMVPTLKLFGVGMIPWSPLARGTLTRPLGGQATTRSGTDTWANYLPTTREANAAIVNRVEEIAKARNISMAQVAISWSLSKDYMTAPIIGTTSLKNLEDIIGAIDVKLTAEEINQLEEPYVPQPISGRPGPYVPLSPELVFDIQTSKSISSSRLATTMLLTKTDFYARLLAAYSARTSKQPSRSDSSKPVEDFDDEEDEGDDCGEDLFYCSSNGSQSHYSLNDTPIPLSFHSDIPLSTTCSLDLSVHLGTVPLLTLLPNGTSIANDLQFCLKKPHPQHAHVWASLCLVLVLGSYLAAIAVWAFFHRHPHKVTKFKSNFEILSETMALEIKLPSDMPKSGSIGKLVYLSGAPMLSGEEVLKRTLKEYGSIVDEKEVSISPQESVKAAVRQDVNVLFRGPFSGGIPLGLNRGMRVSSAPSSFQSGPTPPGTLKPNIARAPSDKLATQPIPVWMPQTSQRSPPRPPPIMTENSIYSRPRWSP